MICELCDDTGVAEMNVQTPGYAEMDVEVFCSCEKGSQMGIEHAKSLGVYRESRSVR